MADTEDLIPKLLADRTDKFLADLKNLTEEFERERRDLLQTQAAIDQLATEDPLVLVRQSVGARRKVYHSATAPCGRTNRTGSHAAGFETMRESEAIALDGGHTKRCPACNWAN